MPPHTSRQARSVQPMLPSSPQKHWLQPSLDGNDAPAGCTTPSSSHVPPPELPPVPDPPLPGPPLPEPPEPWIRSPQSYSSQPPSRTTCANATTRSAPTTRRSEDEFFEEKADWFMISLPPRGPDRSPSRVAHFGASRGCRALRSKPCATGDSGDSGD